METLSLRVTGMTCAHCARTAEAALNRMPGINASVSYDSTIAEIRSDAGIEIEALRAAVRP
ncbi:heavy-metal-associated domain-containing protein, partial [Acidiphilium sp.]|uniref:heavy-metal-associated domain-containing protein n=1 Tax=Acidiphilium sp. TaxID=527 RepID=UPI002587CEF1